MNLVDIIIPTLVQPEAAWCDLHVGRAFMLEGPHANCWAPLFERDRYRLPLSGAH